MKEETDRDGGANRVLADSDGSLGREGLRRDLTAKPFVDLHRPLDVGRLDRQEVPAHVIRDFRVVAADAAHVDRFDDWTAAVGAAEGHFQAAGARLRLVLRFPPQAKAARAAREALGLDVASSRPRSDRSPDDDFFHLQAAAASGTRR